MNFPNLSTYDPLYSNLIDFDFNNDFLDHQIYQIDKQKIFFNVNHINNKIEPLEMIINMIKTKKKINFTMKRHTKLGIVLFKIILINFQFISINNLIDFDFSNDNIFKLETTFTFDNANLIKDDSIGAQRLYKINKILNKENKGIITLTKEELNLKYLI